MVLIGLAFCCSGFVHAYSYWWDELNSVVAADLPLRQIFSDLLLPDVHPPLYQLVLRGWAAVFGVDERGTRSLSLVFALLALAEFVRWNLQARARPAALFAIVFMVSSYLFSYYAQESRPYAMLLCMATALTVGYLRHVGPQMGMASLIGLLVLAWLTSLTHYFGFIFAGLILIATLFQVRRDLRQSGLVVLFGLLCFIWPVLHFKFGGIGHKTGAHFWIQSNGLQTTLSKAALALLPELAVVRSVASAPLQEPLLALLFVAACALVVVFAVRNRAAPAVPRSEIWVARQCAGLVIAFVLIICAVDYNSPISTERNFIVLLPAFAVLVGQACAQLAGARDGFKVALLLLVGVVNFGVGYKFLAYKHAPIENQRAASQFIVDRLGKGASNIVYYVDFGREDGLGEIHRLMAQFYLRQAGTAIQIKPITVDAVTQLQRPFYLLVQHTPAAVAAIQAARRQAGQPLEMYSPPQGVANGAAVLYVQ
jgi:uncharacterized membrane protein